MLDSLRNANRVAAIFHLVSAVAILSIASTKGAPFLLKMERMWAQPQFDVRVTSLNKTIGEAIFNNPWCNNTNYLTCKEEDTCSVFDWFDCLKATRNTNQTKGNAGNWMVDSNDIEGRLYALEPTVVHESLVWKWLFAFEVLTFIFHAVLGTWAQRSYNALLLKRLQPYRWFEYAITSSIMLMCLYALSRVTDVYILLSNFGLSIFLELGGGLIFELLGYILRTTVYKTREDQDVKRMIQLTRWTFYVMSVMVFALAIELVYNAFITIINPYLQLSTGPLWSELFNFIRILNITLLILYSVFPLIHGFEWMWQLLRPNATPPQRVATFLKCEMAYIVASFFSKACLVWTIFVAALQRKDQN